MTTPGGPMLRPGICSVTYRDLPPEEIVPLAAEAGLECIEWGGDVHVAPGVPDLAEHTRVRTEEARSEEHTSELQSRGHLVCRLLLEKKKTKYRETGRSGEKRLSITTIGCEQTGRRVSSD